MWAVPPRRQALYAASCCFIVMDMTTPSLRCVNLKARAYEELWSEEGILSQLSGGIVLFTSQLIISRRPKSIALCLCAHHHILPLSPHTSAALLFCHVHCSGRA